MNLMMRTSALLCLSVLTGTTYAGEHYQTPGTQTTVGVTTDQKAVSGSDSSVTFAPQSSTTVERAIPLPNGLAIQTQAPAKFMDSGPGLAEKSQALGDFLRQQCKRLVTRSDADKPSAQIISGIEGASGLTSAVFSPFPDYWNTTNTTPIESVETVVNLGSLGGFDFNARWSCIGSIAIGTIKNDQQNQVTTDVLESDSRNFLFDKKQEYGVNGFRDVVLVTYSPNYTYTQGMGSEGNGWSLIPQLSGGPSGTPLMTGMMGGITGNSGEVIPIYRQSAVFYVLARSPNAWSGRQFTSLAKWNGTEEKVPPRQIPNTDNETKNRLFQQHMKK